MKEEIENEILDLLLRIHTLKNQEFKCENLHNYQQILDEINPFIPEIKKSLQELFVFWESYLFIRTDNMLMLKARDVWKMEMDTFVDSIKKSINQINYELEVK